MTRGLAVRIDGTGEEGHVVDTRRTGDIIVDTGLYEVCLGPDAVTPIFGGGQLQDCPSCDGRGTTDGVGTCDRCGGTCTVVARPRGTDKDKARARVTSCTGEVHADDATVTVECDRDDAPALPHPRPAGAPSLPGDLDRAGLLSWPAAAAYAVASAVLLALIAA